MGVDSLVYMLASMIKGGLLSPNFSLCLLGIIEGDIIER